jgi:DNA recombination protein RmuC
MRRPSKKRACARSAGADGSAHDCREIRRTAAHHRFRAAVPADRGLYAEILRRPGLTDLLQRDYRVTVAGPTTLTALLNSLQMGFRTLAIEQRSSEVWQVLGAVKSEFGKFGDVLARTKAQLETVTRSIEAAEQRTRVMGRKLKQVEALPDETAAGLLGAQAADGADADDA